MRATNVPVRASLRARASRRSASAPSSATGVRPKSVEPERDDHDVEQERDHERHRQVDRRRDAEADHEKDVDGVLAVVERVAKAHGRGDAAEAEREREAVLHEHDDARHDHGQDDQQLDDRLLIAAARTRERVDPRDRKRRAARRRSSPARPSRPAIPGRPGGTTTFFPRAHDVARPAEERASDLSAMRCVRGKYCHASAPTTMRTM